MRRKQRFRELSFARQGCAIFEVPDLRATVELLGRDRILRYEPAAQSGRASWAVLHDTEGHNILLLDAPNRKFRKRS